MKKFGKDPDALLDYHVDWETYLDSDTIVASSWIVPAGLVLEAQTFTATVASVWLSGGTDGAQYSVVNRIVTAAGRMDDRTIVMSMDDK